jgi:hypothetical protein
MAALAALLAVSPDDVLPKGDPAVGPYIALMAFGFVVAVLGHIVRSKTMIGTGIALIFIAVLVLPLIVHGGGS